MTEAKFTPGATVRLSLWMARVYRERAESATGMAAKRAALSMRERWQAVGQAAAERHRAAIAAASPVSPT